MNDEISRNSLASNFVLIPVVLDIQMGEIVIVFRKTRRFPQKIYKFDMVRIVGTTYITNMNFPKCTSK